MALPDHRNYTASPSRASIFDELACPPHPLGSTSRTRPVGLAWLARRFWGCRLQGVIRPPDGLLAHSAGRSHRLTQPSPPDCPVGRSAAPPHFSHALAPADSSRHLLAALSGLQTLGNTIP